ncbi:MAG: hypothetical protein IPI30_12735 [Saprospiraceae bacterium]|nr:hypothetical protein [Candidatus Vicinibacter affinis]
MKTISAIILFILINFSTIMAQCWQQVSTGIFYNLGIKSDGTLWAWGYNESGKLGDGSLVDKDSPVQIGNNSDWREINGGHYHSLGIKSDGSLWTWGDNSFGQIGDGSLIDKSRPVQIGNNSDWLEVKGGAFHSLGIRKDGTLWVWGDNRFGQLGDGSNLKINKKIPTIVNSALSWKDIDAGDWHSLGIKKDGTLWAWL